MSANEKKSLVNKIYNKISEVGWKGFPSAVFDYICFRSRNHRLTTKITHYYHDRVLYNGLTNRVFPFKKGPILLLSYPRSGSSWLGEVLSYSPELAYLREPVTQALGQKHNYYALINPDRDTETQKKFVTYSDLAFAGIPPRGVKNVVQYPNDFLPLTRIHKRLLIKEVNPLAVSLYLHRYAPTLLLLLRHPAAIADSFIRMGWLSSAWRMFGFEYGKRIKNAITAAGNYQSKILLFEHFADQPKDQFSALHGFLGIQMHDNVDLIIERYTKTPPKNTSPYQIERMSTQEINKWRENLPARVIQQIKEGYLEADLPFYQNETDWCE